MKSAVVFLCNKPHSETLHFAIEMSIKSDFDVFIVSDSMDNVQPSIRYRTIQIADEDCIRNGYTNSNISDNSTHINKNPIAYDKFLFYFCELNPTYDFVWVFEDDVFIPSPQTIVKLHESNSIYDLVTPNNFQKTDTAPDWHWPHIFNKHEPPYFYSMVCAAGFSKEMLSAVSEYVKLNKSLFYIEAMFNTLAFHNDLLVSTPRELKSVVYKGEWSLDDFVLLPDSVFHPLKNKGDYDLYRKQIAKAKANNYQPKKDLPLFIPPCK